MKLLRAGFVLLLGVAMGKPLAAQATPAQAPSRGKVMAAAKAIMQETRYCTFISVKRGIFNDPVNWRPAMVELP